jgi:endonuclease YncB( thermonuclease family)
VEQPFGIVPRDGLRALVLRKSVTIHGQERDRYEQVLARLQIEGKDVKREMVADGLARHFTRYSDDATLAGAEIEAPAARWGLSADSKPLPP